jgi:hypothetical protein
MLIRPPLSTTPLFLWATTHHLPIVVACALAGLIIALGSCTPYRVEYMEESLQQATQAEVVQKFGYPQRLKRVKNGDQLWEYDFQGEERKCVTYVVTFNTDDTVRQWERRDCAREQPRSKPGQ